ncbi:MAG: 5'-methylthioadenosine nucleosidase, partial [Pseudomonadota bacterium]
ERPELACDLVDMEAFALARACRRAGAAFRCVKYVSDAADDAAAEDWDANKARGAALFAQWLDALRD